MPPIPAAGPSPSSACPSHSCILPFGSISMALRFVKPSISLASFPNFCEKASDKLCAGSVEMRSTERRTLASCIAREHDVVVFPTPPLPPTNIHRRVFWSSMVWRVGSSWSSSVLIKAVDMATTVCPKGQGVIWTEDSQVK